MLDDAFKLIESLRAELFKSRAETQRRSLSHGPARPSPGQVSDLAKQGTSASDSESDSDSE